MKNVDILDQEIKGITGRFILWVVGSVGTAIIFVLLTYFAIIRAITASESRILSEVKDMKNDQKVRDIQQDNEIDKKEEKLVFKTIR